jgi:hypothetical protein
MWTSIAPTSKPFTSSESSLSLMIDLLTQRLTSQ